MIIITMKIIHIIIEKIIMPLLEKGKKILAAMKRTYGTKKGKQVFYASQNKGTITGTHKSKTKYHRSK